MVRFATTSYTHMYSNDYIGRPEEPFFHRPQDELTDVGKIVEQWRSHAGMTVDRLVKRANRYNPLRSQTITTKDYWDFVRGKRRITDLQLRTISKALGTTPHVITHYRPDEAPKKTPSGPTRAMIKVDSPPSRAQPNPKPQEPPHRDHRDYDADEAARLLAEKFGKVIRFKH